MTARQKSLALLTLVVALVLEIVDMTIVNIALPAIKRDFGAEAAAAQWVVAGYSLCFALLLLSGGRLGDSFGYRRMFLIGVAGFTLASLPCGLAATADQLVAARLLQGATGAMMAPQVHGAGAGHVRAARAVVQARAVRRDRRAGGDARADRGRGADPCRSAGSRLAADLPDQPADRFARSRGGLRFLPDARSNRVAGIDPLGTVLFGGAVAALLWPMIGATEGGSTSAAAAWLALAALLGVLGWRHVTQRVAATRSALFEPSLFAIPSFRLGLGVAVSFAAASSGFLLVFAFSLQDERGLSPLATGLLHVPFGLGAMIGIGVLGRRFLPLLGRWVLVGGAVLMAIAELVVLTGIGTLGLGWQELAPALLVAGLGMGMISGCVPPVTVAQVDRDHAGAASGLLKTGQQLGAAIGVALAGSVYFSVPSANGWNPATLAGASIALVLVAVALLAWRLPVEIFVPRKAAAAA